MIVTKVGDNRFFNSLTPYCMSYDPFRGAKHQIAIILFKMDCSHYKLQSPHIICVFKIQLQYHY